MFKNLFRRQINNITVAAALVALSSLASRFLGVLRDHILAGQFGASATLDTYYAAFRVPDLIYNLIVLGALSAGFIPIFTSLIRDYKCEKGQNCDPTLTNHEAWGLAANVMNLLGIALVFLSVAGIIFARPLVYLITPGFSPDQQATTAALTRIMFLSPLFLGVSGILGGMLQSFKRFLMYSFAPIFYNLGIIFGALFLTRIWGIYGLAWGVVIGAFLHMASQLPTVYHLGFRYQFKIKWRDANTWLIAKMMVPRTLSLAIAQINLVIVTIIASGLPHGSLAVFNFANNLQAFPVGIFGISFAIAAFPVLSEFAFNKEKLVENFSQTIRKILFFVIPATVLIIALRAQIIRIVLGTGRFGWEDTILTMNTLGFFAISLFAQATIPLLVRVFYARHNSLIPLSVGAVTIAINTILALLLAPRMGVAGLALAFSIDNILSFLLLWVWLRYKVGSLDLSNILMTSLKFIVASVAAGLTTQLTKLAISPIIDMTRFSGVFIQLCLAAGAGLLAYGFFCYLFQSEELLGFLDSLRHHWPFKRVEVEDQGEARGI